MRFWLQLQRPNWPQRCGRGGWKGCECRPRNKYPSKMCANETVWGEIDISLQKEQSRVGSSSGRARRLVGLILRNSSIFHIIPILIRVSVAAFLHKINPDASGTSGKISLFKAGEPRHQLCASSVEQHHGGGAGLSRWGAF